MAIAAMAPVLTQIQRDIGLSLPAATATSSAPPSSRKTANSAAKCELTAAGSVGGVEEARHPSLDDRFDPAVRIVDYDPGWATLAAGEIARIEAAVGEA